MKRRPLRLSAETKLVLLFSLLLWGLSAVIRFGIYLVRENSDWRGNVILVSLIIVAVFLMWLVVKNFRSLPLLIIIIIGPPLAMIIDMIHTELFFLAFDQKFSWQAREYPWKSYLRDTYMGSLFYLTWYLGYFAIVNYYKFVRETLAVSEARAQAHQAELQMLRYQINPHFVFNTLNSISTLVLDSKNDKAERMLGSLSRFLRFSLDKNPEEKISLSEEISVIKEYLAIEKIRYDRKLAIEFDLANDTLDCLVPSLILQPAIENSIKHAITPDKSVCKIKIMSKIVDDHLQIIVSDNGPGLLSDNQSEGVGVKNMRKRIDVMYDNVGALKLRNGNFDGVDVTLMIPIERGHIDLSSEAP